MEQVTAQVRFGKVIQSLRAERKISQETLAELCELDRTYISSVERGCRNISLVNIIKIANALDVDPGFLLTGLGGTNVQH